MKKVLKTTSMVTIALGVILYGLVKLDLLYIAPVPVKKIAYAEANVEQGYLSANEDINHDENRKLQADIDMLQSEIAALAKNHFVPAFKFQDQAIQAYNIALFNFEKATETQSDGMSFYIENIEAQEATLGDMKRVEASEQKKALQAIQEQEFRYVQLQAKYVSLLEKSANQEVELPGTMADELKTIEANIAAAKERVGMKIIEKLLEDIQELKNELNKSA